MGRLHLGPTLLGEAFFDAWVKRASDELPRFLDSAYVGTLVALEQLGVEPGARFFRRFFVASQSSVSLWNDRACVEALTALSAMRVTRLESHTDVLGLKWFRHYAGVVEPLLEYSLSTLQLVAIMQAFGRLRLNANLIGNGFFVSWGKAMTTKAEDLTGEHLYDLMYAFGALKQRQTIGDDLFIRLADRTLVFGESYSAEQLMQVLSTMQRVGMTSAIIGNDWYQRWMSLILPKLLDCDGRQLSLIMTALAHTATDTSLVTLDFVRGWAHQASKSRFDRKQTVGTLWALDWLGYTDMELGKDVVGHLEQSIQRFPREMKRSPQNWLDALKKV